MLTFQLRSPNMIKDILKLTVFPNIFFFKTHIHTHTLDLVIIDLPPVSTSIMFTGGGRIPSYGKHFIYHTIILQWALRVKEKILFCDEAYLP